MLIRSQSENTVYICEYIFKLCLFISTSMIQHCEQMKSSSRCTYRIFDIDNVTALVPLGHTVMPEHWPGQTHKQIVLFADECCVCLRGRPPCLAGVYPLRSCRVVTASEQPSRPGRSNMFPQSGCLSKRTSASVRDTGRKHLHDTDTQMKPLWLSWCK